MINIPPKKPVPNPKKVDDIPSTYHDIEEWPGGASQGKPEAAPDIPEIPHDKTNICGDESVGRKPLRVASTPKE